MEDGIGRRAAIGAGVAALGGLSGCTFPRETARERLRAGRWFYTPGEVGRNNYPVEVHRPGETLRALDRVTPGRADELERYYDRWIPGWLDHDRVRGVGTFEGDSWALVGRLDPTVAAEHLREAGFEPSGAVGTADLFERSRAETEVVGVDHDRLVGTTESSRFGARSTAEAILDAWNGRADRYVESRGEFRAVWTRLAGGSIVVAETFPGIIGPQRIEADFQGLTAAGWGLKFRGGRTRRRLVLVFEDVVRVPVAEIRTWLPEHIAAPPERVSGMAFDQDDRVVVASWTVPTDAV